MSFILTLSFIRDHDRQLFEERVVPKLRGTLVEPPEDAEAEAQGYHRLAVSVTSPSAARDVCRHALGFLSHIKNGRIIFSWTGADGSAQFGDLNAGEGRDAELLAMRIGAAAKAACDAGRAPEDTPAANADTADGSAEATETEA